MARLVVMVALAYLATACASGPSLQSAINVHNTMRRVISTVDSNVAPLYAEAGKAADAAFPNDNVAFQKAMAPMDLTLSILSDAKQAEQLFQLGLAQWQLGVSGGQSMAEEMAACAAESFDRLGQAVTLLPTAGTILYGVTGAMQLSLLTLAHGATCQAAHAPIATGVAK